MTPSLTSGTLGPGAAGWTLAHRQHSHNHKVFSSHRRYGFGSFDDRYTLVTALAAEGCRTALVGKYLNGYGRQPSRVTGGPACATSRSATRTGYASVEPPKGAGISGGPTYLDDNVVHNHNGRIDDRHEGSTPPSASAGSRSG